MEKDLNVDINNFIVNYERDWIIELRDDYLKLISKYDVYHKKFFDAPGNWGPTQRNNDLYFDSEISDYFKRLLYLPNVAVLDFIIRNREEFQDLKFLDNGAGFGLLSIFMKKLNLDCYNFDNYEQMGNINPSDDSFFKKYDINPPSKLLPNDINIMMSNGIFITEDGLIDSEFDYLFIDSMYLTENSAWDVKWPNRKRFWSKVDDNYNLEHQYDGVLSIFRHK